MTPPLHILEPRHEHRSIRQGRRWGHAECGFKRLPSGSLDGFGGLLQLRGAVECVRVGSNQGVLFSQRRHRDFKTQKALWRDPFAATGAGSLALQISPEVFGAQQVMQKIGTQHFGIGREYRVLAGDDRFRDAVGNEANRTVAGVDLREREITGVGANIAPLNTSVRSRGSTSPENLMVMARQSPNTPSTRTGSPRCTSTSRKGRNGKPLAREMAAALSIQRSISLHRRITQWRAPENLAWPPAARLAPTSVQTHGRP